MQRVLSMIVMLALVAVMAVPGNTLDGAPFKLEAAGHGQLVDFALVDLPADCCGIKKSKRPHAMDGCSIDCNNAVPSIIAHIAEPDADLRICCSGGVPDDVALPPFRPPNAA